MTTTTATCLAEVPTTNALEFWAPLVVAIIGLPLCGAFLYESAWRYSSVMFASTQAVKASAHGAESLERGKRQETGFGSSSSSTPPTSNSSNTTSSIDRGSLPRTLHRQQKQQQEQGGRFTVGLFTKNIYQLMKHSWPKSTNQLLVTCSLLCWTALLLDQVFVVGHMYSVTVLCPEWACRNATPTRTPGCPASTFIRTIPGLNSMGLFSYVIGAIHRVSRVYSTMSPLRHRIIQLFSTLAVIVLIARMASVSMLAHVSFMPTSLAAPDSSRKEAGIEQIAGPIYTLVYSIFFTVLLVVDVGSTAISLHFVIDCRARLNVLALQATKSAPQTTGSLKSQAVALAMDSDNDSVSTNLPTAASPSLALAVPDGPSSSSRRGSDRKGSFAASIPESPLLSLTSPRRKSSGTPMNTIPRDSLGLTSSGTTSAIHSTQERNRLGRRKRMKAAVSRVLALTAIKVTLFALFALVRFTPLLAGRISARLADAIVTIILKLFIAAATQGITTMTRLVALRH